MDTSTTYIINAPEDLPFGFSTTKSLLAILNVNFEEADNSVLQSLRVFQPLNKSLANEVRSNATSLTDSATPQEQIRFSQRRRMERDFIKIGRYINSQLGPLRIEIGNCEKIDEGSKAFFAKVSKNGGWDIVYKNEKINSVNHPLVFFSVEEKNIYNIISERKVDNHIDEIFQSAFDYINVGDSYTGIILGKILLNHEKSSRAWNLMAISNAMLNKPESAEYYYIQWAKSSEKLDKVRAYYGLAMLYTRHHILPLRDLGIAEEYLEKAYNLILQMPNEDRQKDEVKFDEVFNRNGYALILFRKGMIDEAISLMKWGISELKMTGERVGIHRSVLVYNLAQCYKAIGSWEECLKTYKNLLNIDPYMPEYYLEAAKCYAACGDLEKAVELILQSIEIDDSLDVSWALLGLYYSRLNRFEESNECFKNAYNINVNNKRFVDYLISIIKLGNYQEALNKINSYIVTSLVDVDKLLILKAECLLKLDSLDKSYETLRNALEIFPKSKNIKRNIEILENDKKSFSS